jgi:hypothetical protein
MRLPAPRVKLVQRNDEWFVLTYEGLDTTHDLGGGNYLFRTMHGDQQVEVKARVRDVTSFNAEKYAAKEGVDYRVLGL